MYLILSGAQTRIRTGGDTQATTHKMIGGVTLVGGNGSELTRLPGGAELNILPANGMDIFICCLFVFFFPSID